MHYYECSIWFCISSDYLGVCFGNKVLKEKFNSKIINYSSDIINGLSLIYGLIPVSPWLRFKIYYSDRI